MALSMANLGFVFVFLTLTSPKIVLSISDPALSPDLFYPFGNDLGDRVMVTNDDGSTENIPIGIGFPFFATNNSRLYVNTNGAISFGADVSTFTPAPFPTERRMIAPYWCDVDTTRNNGRVYFRQSTDENLLERATKDVRDSFTNQGLFSFNAKWIFIATWHNVTFYGGNRITPTNTFQAVLITDGRYSISMFNYGTIRWTTGTASGGNSSTGLGGTAAQVGFDAGDRTNFFAVPGSRESTIIGIGNSTNTGKTGRWIFRVDMAEIRPSGSCGDSGRCAAYQVFDSGKQNCSDVAPAFQCPKLLGPEVINRIWVEFYCEVPTEETRTDAVYRVTFLFNGEPSQAVPPVDVYPPQKRATLHEKQLHGLLGKWISCKAVSFWQNTSTRKISQELSSVNSYFAGIEVSPQTIIVQESDPAPVIVTLKSTLPITCYNEQDTVCDLTLVFQTSDDIVLLKEEEPVCSQKISYEDWNRNESKAFKANQPIKVFAKVDLIISSPRPNLLKIAVASLGSRSQKRLANGGSLYTNMWHEYSVQPIQVYHYDAPHAVCRATGDPNLTTLDRVYYPLYDADQFTYVETTHGTPIEIQVRHRPCGQVVSCACGVAAREGDVILIIDRCTDRYVHSVTPNDLNDLPRGVGITQDNTGRTLEMVLPSNVKVTAYIQSWGLNLEIRLTPAEFGRTRGLCGTFDGNSSNDLWVKGQAQPTTVTYVTEVINSWRIPQYRSLFEGYKSRLNEGQSNQSNPLFQQFCTCSGNGQDNCGATRNDNTIDPTSNRPKTNTLQQTGGSVTGNTIDPSRRKRSVDAQPDSLNSDEVDWNYDSQAYYALVNKTDGNFHPVNASNFTEAETEEFCRKVLWEDSPIKRLCTGKVKTSDIDGIIRKCVSDIQMTGDKSWADDKVQEIQDLCLFEVITANVTTSGITVDALKATIRDLSDHICVPPDCSRHGVCTAGNCVCNQGYIGYDCSVEENTVPKITSLLSQSTCDVGHFLCEKVEFLTEGAVASPTFTCKVEVKKFDNSVETIGTTGTVKSSNVTSCELASEKFLTGLRKIQRRQQSNNESLNPNDNTDLGFHSLPPGNPILHCMVSVSNKGQRYSQPIPYTILDSKCFKNDSTQKTNTCLIEGYCFAKDEVNPFNPECEFCDPALSSNKWSKQSDPSCDPCRSSPCSGQGPCISPYKGIYRCQGSKSRGNVLLSASLSVASLLILTFVVLSAIRF